jgi:hypothetical protein
MNGSLRSLNPLCGMFHRACWATLPDCLLLTTPTLRPLDTRGWDQAFVRVPHITAALSGPIAFDLRLRLDVDLFGDRDS